MTSTAHRYKLRACLTCLAQVRTLLREIQSNPDPLSIHEDYEPLRSLGDEDQPAPRDVISTPRPLNRSRSNARTPVRSAGHFGDTSDLFPTDDDDAAPNPERDAALFDDAELDLEEDPEDGRATALAAVAGRAEKDPRFATIQGLLQHVDQLALENDVDRSSSAGSLSHQQQPRTLDSYPSWILPQVSQIFGTINSMYPTPWRLREDRREALRASAFRLVAQEATREAESAQRFEQFLERNLEEARKRQEKLEELGQLKAATGAADEKEAAAAAEKAAASPSKRKSSTAADPFAAFAASEANVPADDAGNERKRLERRAEHLRTLSPTSRKAFLHSEALSNGVREGGLKDTKHRPAHQKPFGYCPARKKKIGDPLPPLSKGKASAKYDQAPRSSRAADLYAPRKSYAISASHPKSWEQMSEAERRREIGAQRQMQQDADGEEHEAEGEEEQEQREPEDDDDDPFAAHDPDAAATSSTPARHRHDAEEEKEQEGESSERYNRHRPEALQLDDEAGDAPGLGAAAEDEEDDPFAAHDPDAAPRTAKRADAAPSAKARPTRTPVRPKSSAHTAAASSSAAKATPRSARAQMQHAPTPATIARTVKSGRALSPTPTAAAKHRLATRPASARRPGSPPPTRKRPSAAATAAAATPSVASAVDDPFASHSSLHRTGGGGPSHLLSSSRRGLFDDGDAASWQDVELKLLALNEEVKEQRTSSSAIVKQEVDEAMRKLSETLQQQHSAASASDALSETNDMSTLAWDNALMDVFAKGKRIVKDLPEGETLTAGGSSALPTPLGPMSPKARAFSLSQSMSRSGSMPHGVDAATVLNATLASAQLELNSTRSREQKLAAEKQELEKALAQLQARDNAHAQSLFQLMDKLNSMGPLALAKAQTPQARLAAIRQASSTRAALEQAAFVEPFGSPLSPASSSADSAAAARRRLYPLGTPQAHGSRSLALPSLATPSPDDVEAEALEQPAFVEGLGAAPASSFNSPDPLAAHASEEEQERKAYEARLLELEQDLSNAQRINVDLKSKLDAATFHSAVLTRTAESNQMFVAQNLIQTGENERVKEQARLEVHSRQHQEDLRKIQASERAIAAIQEEQRQLKSRFEASKAEAEAHAAALAAELAQTAAAKEKALKDANLLRMRLDQLLTENAQGQSRTNAAGRFNSPLHRQRLLDQSQTGADGSPASALFSPSSFGNADALAGLDALDFDRDGESANAGGDFINFLTSSFRGDYLKLKHHTGLTHTLASQQKVAAGAGLQSSEVHEEVIFSDYVTKFNRRNAGQPRIIVLTQTALYVLTGGGKDASKKLELRRRIPLQHIASVGLSRLCTDLIVIHLTAHDEHDLLLTSPKRPELMYHLQSLTKSLWRGQKSLEYELGERLYVKDREGMVREVQVLSSQSFKLGKAFPTHGAVRR